MKYTILKLLLLLLILPGCGLLPDPVGDFEGLKVPIVVVGKSVDGDVTVLDQSNTYVTIPSHYYLGSTIFDSYGVGDTIIFFKK